MPLCAWICHMSGWSADENAAETLFVFNPVLATSSSPSACLKVLGELGHIPHSFQKALLELSSGQKEHTYIRATSNGLSLNPCPRITSASA